MSHYKIGQVFETGRATIRVVGVPQGKNGFYSLVDVLGYKVDLTPGELKEYVDRGVFVAVKSDEDALFPVPFEIGSLVKTKNNAIFAVLDYDCVNGYLRGQPHTGTPQILKIENLTQFEEKEPETEVDDEMVSLNEVCQVLRDNGESYLSDILVHHFAEKKLEQDPEYLEYLRLKEKFGG